MAITFDHACSLLETTLSGTVRQEIVSGAAAAKDFGQALARLRDGMRSNVFKTAAGVVNLDEAVTVLDRRTRHDGIHALHDWDGKAGKLTDETFAVEVLNYVLLRRGADPVDRAALAILLDYYFLYLLALLSLRIWDTGSADTNLDHLNRLLGHLQGPNGGGQPFAADAETLILIATSHYERDERGYADLLVRVRTLNRVHQAAVAQNHAGCLGSHLRFGYEAQYGRDTVLMRKDNVADYPWVCFAVATLMKEYARMHAEHVHGVERERVVEALLNGLSFDPNAFVGEQPPASLAALEADRTELHHLFSLFSTHRQDLVAEFERYRPSDAAYSPLALYCNFSQNALKGMVIDALLWGDVWPLTLNDLMTGVPRDDPKGESKARLAKALMGYARAQPDTIRGRLMPAIVYDSALGRRAYAMAMRQLKG